MMIPGGGSGRPRVLLLRNTMLLLRLSFFFVLLLLMIIGNSKHQQCLGFHAAAAAWSRSPIMRESNNRFNGAQLRRRIFPRPQHHQQQRGQQMRCVHVSSPCRFQLLLSFSSSLTSYNDDDYSFTVVGGRCCSHRQRLRRQQRPWKAAAPPPPPTTTTTVLYNNSRKVLDWLISGGDVLSVWDTTLVGQADRAFRLGIQLEKNGQARRASEAFHEAATLYQCYLDCSKTSGEFGHVTILCRTPKKEDQDEQPQDEEDDEDDEDCGIVLAYACLRLAFLSWDALGYPQAAVRLYKEAIMADPYPSAASYQGLGQCIEATHAGHSLLEAIEAYRTALVLNPTSRVTMFRLAVALERVGSGGGGGGRQSPSQQQLQKHQQPLLAEAEQIFEFLRRQEADYACLVDSWGYVRWHTRKIPMLSLNLYRGTRTMLELALSAAQPLIQQGGLVTEFGVGSGRSLRFTQELLPLHVPIHGFDTFTGLPQPWGKEPVGTYSTGGILPTMEGGTVSFHKGLFRDTVPRFLEQLDQSSAATTTTTTTTTGDDNNNGTAAASSSGTRTPPPTTTPTFWAYANIDCDLYSSTLDILECMHGRLVPGTVLVFDEYLGHATWRQDEFRAWRECCNRFGWKYEYLAFSLATKQAVVRVLEA